MFTITKLNLDELKRIQNLCCEPKLFRETEINFGKPSKTSPTTQDEALLAEPCFYGPPSSERLILLWIILLYFVSVYLCLPSVLRTTRLPTPTDDQMPVEAYGALLYIFNFFPAMSNPYSLLYIYKFRL